MIRHNALFPSSRAELEAAYSKAQPGGYWFSPDTMRFFKSRIHDVYQVPNAGGWAFITSEKGPTGVRAYTVRTMNDAGKIGDGGGGFQGYATLGRARTGLKAYAASATAQPANA